jgi:hypothetical protein
MDNARSSSNWLALLRRKIQKKLKRSREKVTTENQICENDENQETTAQVVVEEEEVQQQQQQPQPNQECETIGEEYREMTKELFKLSCYWPKLTRAGAQKILKNTQNGSFLIRDSGTADHSITLSFRSNNKTFHCRNQWNQILNSTQENSNIITAIEDSIKRSQNTVVGFVKSSSLSVPIAVRLIYPVNRKVPSLENLCLRSLCLVVRNINLQTPDSAINSLPLPPKIKSKINDELLLESYKTL